MAEPLVGTATGQAHGIQRVRYTHDAMIDQMISNPVIKQEELAVIFGFSSGWVSRVIGSDAFQARLAERKVEIVNPEIKRTVEERIQGLAIQSLAVLEKKLDSPSVSPETALRAFDISAKALGFGARVANVQQTNNYVVALPPKADNEANWAENARAEAKALATPRAPVVVEDVAVREIPQKA